MRINILAGRNRGSAPFATREVTVEPDGSNVYLSFPEPTGVISGDSALTLGEAILEAAGFAPEASSDTIPPGWNLKSSDGGFIITDSEGVVRGNFRPVSSYVSV